MSRLAARAGLAGLVLVGLPMPLHAQATPAAGQPAGARVAAATTDPALITGRSFAGVRLPLAPSGGAIELRAARAWTWTVQEPAVVAQASGAPTAGATTRLILEGDVRLTLGAYRFAASKAALWMEPIGPAPGGGTLWQVFAYLAGASTAAGGPDIAISGERVPVQGVVELPPGASVSLSAVRRQEGPPDDPFVREGERALASRLRAAVRPEAPTGGPTPDELVARGEPVPPLVPQPTRDPLDLQLLRDAERALGPAADTPVFAREGVFTFSGGTVDIASDEAENTITLTGPVVITYWDARRDRTLQLSAERAVVFLKPGPLAQAARLSAEQVLGVYLEGDVRASDGRYNLRSPRVYYDVAANRAVLLDAVFWTFDEKRRIPLYVRAKTIRQESANQFSAESARLTNVAFFDPDLSIGASRVTISRRESRQGDERLFVDARDITLRAVGVPFFYWPVLRGEPDQIPLRDIRIENSNQSGAAVKTRWNLPVLLGVRAEDEFRADLLLDYYFDRGLGIGALTGWSGPSYAGSLLAYTVPNDRGKDILSSGERLDQKGEFRGIITGEHRAQIDDRWTLFAEGAHVSDVTFVDAFFEPLARTRREFTNSVYLQRLEGNTALSARVQGSFNDYLVNEYLLQTPGYAVQRFPDVRYARFADDLWPASPGLVTYSSEYRASAMRLRFDQALARQRGFSFAPRAQSAFGILPNESIADALRRRGFTQTTVGRLDTRQELTMALAAGPVNITPFIAGRGTAYTEDFNQYAPREDDPYRLWAGGGVTVSTELQRVYNGVRSRTFDVTRLRHLVRPSLTVWHGDATRDQETLPIYDAEVEQLQSGTAWRLALDQVLQTQRGGPGRWRSVDLVTWENELVVPSGDSDRVSPIGRWYDARPEYSFLGESFWRSDATWQLSEVVALGGGAVFDFKANQLARSNAAITLQHGADFQGYAEVRSIGALNETFVNFGASYQFTRTYAASVNASYNTELGDIQTISGEVRRQFPNVLLGVGISYNNITGETSFGFTFQPLGARGRGVGAGGFGSRDGVVGLQ